MSATKDYASVDHLNMVSVRDAFTDLYNSCLRLYRDYLCYQFADKEIGRFCRAIIKASEALDETISV